MPTHFFILQLRLHGTSAAPTWWYPLGTCDMIMHASVPLTLHHTFFCVSFTFFLAASESGTSAGATGTSVSTRAGAGGELPPPWLLLDPAGLEQCLAYGMLNLALTPLRELTVVHKAGGLALVPGVFIGAI